MILNIIHRPEMVPEYAEKITGQGQEENIGRGELLTESLDIFKLQQEIAHKNGFKTTIQMTYASLFHEEAVALAKEHHKIYGDEIALTLLGLPCEEFRKRYKTKDFCIWMFSIEDKKSIVKDVFEQFYGCFGFYPESTGSYYMDAELINYIKEQYPMIKCAVATCFEEGPKAYHTCNNSWYTLFDGGPWNPWIPSKQNTHAPAENEAQDSGIVAIPHLSRDLIACFDGNGSNFGTHPQNVLRGMIYKDGEYPYLYNLIDQYRHLKEFNRGYAYNMMFVGPGWMNKMGRWEAPFSLLLKSYEDGMRYYAALKEKGELEEMTMSEFADFYRSHKTYTQPECALWQDILYGSEKQLFWYVDPYMRTCIDMNQGGAMVDLRPYVSKIDWPVGIGTKHVQDASYPFLIQEKYRAGYFTHYAGEGTIKSCKVLFEGEEVDLCLCRTKAKFSEEGNTRILTLNPVEICFQSLTVSLQTVYYFEEGSSAIRVKREILNMSRPVSIEIVEYFTGCYGTTEYPEDMSQILLHAKSQWDGEERLEEIVYNYACREANVQHATRVSVTIPAIDTRAIMRGEKHSGNGTFIGQDCDGFIKEGYAFSPMYTIGLKTKLEEKEAFISWLKLEKVD